MALFALALALSLTAAACGGGDDDGDGGDGGGGGTITIGGDEANDHGTESIAGKDEVELEADDFYFGPTVLEGEAGQTFKIDIENESSSLHSFTVDDLGIDEDIAAEETTEVEITLPDSGDVVFYCKYHKTQGMIGEITVG
jgi:plastocyanin